MSLPYISIVMPSFNQAAYIEEAIQSVLTQGYPRVELIVIDGKSTDGSAQIIERYGAKLAYWVSEEDRGQSHAINKGMRVASGNLLSWLNSDDVLLPGALHRVGKRFQAGGSGAHWITGSCLWMDQVGRVLRCARGNVWSSALARLGLVNVGGPSSFFSSDLFKRAGGLEEGLHYMMDTELWLRFARLGMSYGRASGYLWALRLHPEAKMSGHHFNASALAAPSHPAWEKRRVEREYIRTKYGVSDREQLMARGYSRALRTCTLATGRALLDTIRYRGEHWQHCINDEGSHMT